MLLAPVIMLAFTFLVPLTTFAEPEPDEQPIVIPHFVKPDQDVYRVRATDIELQTAPTVEEEAVIFIAGEEEIPGVKSVSKSDDKHAIWNPSRAPNSGAVMTARVEEKPVSGQIVLRDQPVLTLNPLDGERSGASLSVTGTIEGVLAGTTVVVRLVPNANDAKDYEVVLDGRTELAQISLAEVPTGEYQVQLIAFEGKVQITDVNTPVFIRVITPPDETEVETPPIIIATPSPDIYIPKIDVVPIELLSTNFSIPVAANIVATTKRSSIFQATAAPPNGEVQGVATEERATVENVVDLTADEQPVVPLAPTSGGWSLFGVSWYWWVGSIAATWVAGMSLRLWLRKP